MDTLSKIWKAIWGFVLRLFGLDKDETPLPKKSFNNKVYMAFLEEQIALGSSVEMRLIGFSMRPFLRNGKDDIVLSPMEGVTIRKGMVVLFRSHGTHILHRVRRVEKNGRLVIKGDGNYRKTEYATTRDVVAWVSRVIPNGRGRGFAYGSLRWHLRSAWSLTVKVVLNFGRDIKYGLKRKLKL